MDLGQIFSDIWFIENKEQTAWHSPSEIQAMMHTAQLDIYDKFAPLYGTDETAKKALDPFVQIIQFTPANTPLGVITLPINPPAPAPANPLAYGTLLSADCISYDNIRGVQPYPVDIVNNDEWSLRMRNQLDPVTYSRPIAKTMGNGVIQLYPQLPNTVSVTYLSIPVPPVYSYTQNGRVITYNAAGSTQLQWNDSFISAIKGRTLYYLGVNIEDPLLIQLFGGKDSGQ